MTMMDADNDGIVDLNDVRVAARGICDRLRDKEPSLALAPKETQDRFERRFLALVTTLFKAADVDGDGKVEKDELRTPAGRNLEKLLMR
jgi:Ca2+-binding EF-hand superfamily protein